MCSCISPMTSRMLSSKASIVQGGQTTSALRVIIRSSKTGHKTLTVCVNVENILIFNFCKQKFVQHVPITIAIDCTGLSFVIFEKKWSNYAYGPKSAPNSDSFFERLLFNICVRVFCAPNATILLVYIPAKIKISFIWKDYFFLSKSSSFVCRSQVHLAKRIHNHIRSAEE